MSYRDNCLICFAPVTLWVKKGIYQILKCTRCGFGFAYPRPVLDTLKRFYAERNHSFLKSPKVKRYRSEMPGWKDTERPLRITLDYRFYDFVDIF